jgi:hypothetical protein
MNGGIYPKSEVHSPELVSGFFIRLIKIKGGDILDLFYKYGWLPDKVMSL